jgi:hypothetical protein
MDEAQKVDDLAESIVIKSIQEGNTGDAKWWLERRRRDKFAQRQEITGAEGEAVTVKVIKGVSVADL